MSAVVLERLRDLFLAGDTAVAVRPAHQVAERAVPATLGVLVSPCDAPAAGAALGLAVAAAHRAPCVLVCRWARATVVSHVQHDRGRPSAEPVASPRSGLAVGAARTLAQRLGARGLAAGACGRVVTVALPPVDVQARAAVERAVAAAGDIPLVLVVAGPRPSAFDPLLADLDRLIVVPASDAPPGLEPLALTTAAQLGRSVGLLRRPTASTTGRILAATGLPLSPAWRAATIVALRGADD